jgi:hypothetical protein
MSQRIFLVNPDDGFELVRPVEKQGIVRLTDEVRGSAIASWTPPVVKIIEADERGRLRPSDSPWLAASTLVFTDKARRYMGEVLLRHGQLLPLTCDRSTLWLYNVTSVLPALDETKSRVLRHESGKAFGVLHYVFIPSQIGDVEVFKIDTLPVSPTYVTEQFVDRWLRAGLVGLTFKKIFG